MRVLYVGGAGYVGGLILPELVRHHSVRVLDPGAPAVPCDHLAGDATDADTVAGAMAGVDVVLHGALARKHVGHDSPADAAASLDVNVKSVYLTLRLAHEAGVRHAVVLSSLSVYRDLLSRRSLTEDVPADAGDAYGLSKRLGEQVCQAAVAEWGISVTALRLVWPTPDQVWPAWQAPDGEPVRQHASDGTPVPGLAASDLARAVLAALDHRAGFEVVTLAGGGQLADLRKAREVLGWVPRVRAR